MYKVTVREIKTEPYTKSEWTIVAEENGEKKWGYATPTPSTREVDRVVYEQTVDVLNLQELVKVVNDIPAIPESVPKSAS